MAACHLADKAGLGRFVQSGLGLCASARARGRSQDRSGRAQSVRRRTGLAARTASRCDGFSRLRSAPGYGHQASRRFSSTNWAPSCSTRRWSIPHSSTLRSRIWCDGSKKARRRRTSCPRSSTFRTIRPSSTASGTDSWPRSSDIPLGIPRSNRAQNRKLGRSQKLRTISFKNTPDTDPAIAANRNWARESNTDADFDARGGERDENLVVDASGSRRANPRGSRRRREGYGATLGADAAGRDPARLSATCSRPPGRPARGHGLRVREGDREGDPEVSEVVDFAHYYAERGRELDRIDGASFIPATDRRNSPVELPSRDPRRIGVLAALASGSPVILKPAGKARRCGAVAG